MQRVKDTLGMGGAPHPAAEERAAAGAAGGEACQTCVPAPAPVAFTEATTERGEAVCGQEFFTRTEDRPVVKEHIERIVEHRPVEREYVVETRATGVERYHTGRTEVVGVTERVVSEAAPTPPCEDPAIVQHRREA